MPGTEIIDTDMDADMLAIAESIITANAINYPDYADCVQHVSVIHFIRPVQIIQLNLSPLINLLGFHCNM